MPWAKTTPRPRLPLALPRCRRALFSALSAQASEVGCIFLVWFRFTQPLRGQDGYQATWSPSSYDEALVYSRTTRPPLQCKERMVWCKRVPFPPQSPGLRPIWALIDRFWSSAWNRVSPPSLTQYISRGWKILYPSARFPDTNLCQGTSNRFVLTIYSVLDVNFYKWH